MKSAFITGVTGQDGAYLSAHLLKLGYKVIGGVRQISSPNLWRLDVLGVTSEIEFVEFDLRNYQVALDIIAKYKPQEVYNLAAQSFVAESFENPRFTAESDALGVMNLLEAIRVGYPEARFYQASSSELFGKSIEDPQTEKTRFYPRSPYAVAKLYGHWTTINYRESYGLFASTGILYNHESPLRGTEFVTRKICRALARIKLGQSAPLELGNTEAKRDWGFAGDYVDGMYRILNADQPDDFVLATGVSRSVQNFVDTAASFLDINLEWSGQGLDRVAHDKKNGNLVVKTNPRYYRPIEIGVLRGSPKKAEENLDWRREMSFEGLVEMMVKADHAKAVIDLEP